MASPLYCHSLGDDLSLEAPVLVPQLFESRHEGGIHPTVFRTPVVEGGRTDAVLVAKFRDRGANLGLVENGDDLCITLKRDVFM
jgi:hypothetical protein